MRRDRAHSMMTSAAMASTIGTARGTTHGSCLPLAASTPAEPSYVAVGCSFEIVAGDLKAQLRTLKRSVLPLSRC